MMSKCHKMATTHKLNRQEQNKSTNTKKTKILRPEPLVGRSSEPIGRGGVRPTPQQPRPLPFPPAHPRRRPRRSTARCGRSGHIGNKRGARPAHARYDHPPVPFLHRRQQPRSTPSRISRCGRSGRTRNKRHCLVLMSSPI